MESDKTYVTIKSRHFCTQCGYTDIIDCTAEQRTDKLDGSVYHMHLPLANGHLKCPGCKTGDFLPLIMKNYLKAINYLLKTVAELKAEKEERNGNTDNHQISR